MQQINLFKESLLREFLEHRKDSLITEIEGMKDILNVKDGELMNYLVSNYSLEVPKLIEKDIAADVNEGDWTGMVERRPGYGPEPISRKGLVIKVYIPFEGDPELFRYQANTYSPGEPLYAELDNQELMLEYRTTEQEPEKIDQLWQRGIDRIKDHLSWTEADINNYNIEINQLVKEKLSSRKAKVKSNQSIIASLKIPVRKRTGESVTYVTPLVRKKVNIERPKPTTTKLSKPEPVIAEEDYEDILETIYNMALVIEKSPRAFFKLNEEDIRFHFLIPLNAYYEGQATGETFNFKGKTDILIRVENKNIFIAECAFWKGKKYFLGKIDQLLGYTSWRDTKTSILIFNKNKEMTKVIKEIESIVIKHNNYKESYELSDKKLSQEETILSFKFSQPRDKNKELILSVLIFDIPTIKSSE